jgi:hypothetical protein
MVLPPPPLLLAPHLVNKFSMCLEGCVLIVRQSLYAAGPEIREKRRKKK